MQLGKLACRGLVNAVSPGRLVHVVDQLSHRRFLVDTGASFSVYPHSSASPPHGPALAGAAGQPIPCWGEKRFQLSFNGRVFNWPFLLAAVQFPILGVDFLRYFGLLVDPAGDRLVDRLTRQQVQGNPSEAGDCLYMAYSLQRSFVPPHSSPHRPLLGFTGLYSLFRLLPGWSGRGGRQWWDRAGLRRSTCKSALRVSWDAFGGRRPCCILGIRRQCSALGSQRFSRCGERWEDPSSSGP